jgi:DNA-binding NarL/FixJ family response regulator
LEVYGVALRILIVDDSKTVRRITRTILRSRHWTVCGEADDGVSGVQKFEQLKPDVVLLDLSMPDINGIEAARLMFAADSTIPLILFTILDIGGIEDEVRLAGIRAIVSKNEAWNLIPSIEALLSHRSRTQAH